VVHDTTSGDKKYARPSVDAAGVEALIAAFNAGELKPTVKSEAVPEDNSAPVTVLVAKNFDDIVTAPGKTILLEFYAPVRPARESLLRLCTLWPCALQGAPLHDASALSDATVCLACVSPARRLAAPPRSGAATARRWPPFTTRLARTSRAATTSSSPRWTPPPTT
jgi:hypothetical protein